MTEMEKLNKETEESNMDYVDDPADDYPKEGWFSKFKSKSKTVGKKIGKGAAIAAITGAATAAAGVIACKLTGTSFILMDNDLIKDGLASKAKEELVDKATDVVETVENIN